MPVGASFHRHRRAYPAIQRHRREQSVVFLPRLRATLPYALWPLGALALVLLMEVCVPHSSTATKRRGSTPAARSRKAALVPSSRSEATGDFFERPAASGQAGDGPAHRGGRRRDAPSLLESLAVLLERQVGVLLQVGRQPLS
jgi:hypothetical protein